MRRKISSTWVITAMIAALLVGLPVATWLDLNALTEANLRRQAAALNAMISGVRAYYAANVVDRVRAAPGVATKVLPNYADVPGAIPLPATLSIELGRVIGAQQQEVVYRFVSDLPFRGRAAHPLDIFERASLATLRTDSSARPEQTAHSVSRDSVRVVAPVVMESACVACHNSDPDSPKRDWRVGDVRGIQEIAVSQPIVANLFSFKYLLAYFAFMASAGAAFVVHQRSQTAAIAKANAELERNNDFLATLSMKISRYLSPQVYKSIFSGQKDVAIQTERKRLTIFFSDIKDFAATTERLQPEQITTLLNEYFTEMSRIAQAHGGTIDKFIGDAMLIFFGDPESKGEIEDAKSCLRMAFDMQKRLAELDAKWRSEGIERPFQVRMGINTGYCNVGNFGSEDRMQYTIIGAEANLAARLQAIAEPGQIVISYETYSVVRDMVNARALPSLRMKGVGREIEPYAVKGPLDTESGHAEIFSAHVKGLDFFMNAAAVGADAAPGVRDILRRALAALGENASPVESQK
jgi:class 3 adenylate cyclase